MKHFILAILLFSGVIAFAQRISADFYRQSMAEALLELESRYSVRINFIYDELEDFSVTQHIDDKPMEQALKMICGLYPVRIIIKDGEYFVECIQKAPSKIVGQVVDECGQPMPCATVMLLNPIDSICINSGVSNENGDFVVPCLLEDVIVKVSYVGYKTLFARSCVGKLNCFKMQLDNISLQSISVCGRKNVANEEAGVLSYDIPSLLSLIPVDNAFQTLMCLPGFYEENLDVYYCGRTVRIAFDGKQSIVPNYILKERLRYISAREIEKIDILFASSSMSNGDGLLVNIVTRKSGNLNQTTAQLSASLQQNRYMFGNVSGNLQMTKGKLSVDARYVYDCGYNYASQRINAVHPYMGYMKYNDATESKLWIRKNSWRVVADYTFAKKDELEISYEGELQNNNACNSTRGVFPSQQNSNAESTLHNVDVGYKMPLGFALNVQYLNYSNSLRQIFNAEHFLSKMGIHANSKQSINQWHVAMNKEFQLDKFGRLSCGFNSQFNFNDTRQQSTDMTGVALFDSLTKVNYLERILHPYVECVKNIGRRLNVKSCISAEWYDGVETRGMNWLPSCCVSWSANEHNIFMISLNSNLVYPNYWTTLGCVNYSSGYVEIWGNPKIKEYSHYMTELTWRNTNRNTMGFFVDYNSGYILRQPYLLQERPVVILKDMNADYRLTIGTYYTTQYSLGQWLNGNVNFVVNYRQDKREKYNDLSFDRNVVVVTVSGSVFMKLLRRYDLYAVINPSFSSKDIAGLYDISPLFRLDARLQWSSENKRWGFCLSGANITNCSRKLTANFGTFNFIIKNVSSQSITLTATYNIGDYKTKSFKKADISRMSR